MRTVYLAGPIAGCSDGEAISWRDKACSHLEGAGYRVLDPMVRDYRGCALEQPYKLVADDLADIDESDVVLANCWQKSVGTSMELFYAYRRSKRVIVAAKQPSPWLVVHSTELYSSIDEALAAL